MCYWSIISRCGKCVFVGYQPTRLGMLCTAALNKSDRITGSEPAKLEFEVMCVACYGVGLYMRT